MFLSTDQKNRVFALDLHQVEMIVLSSLALLTLINISVISLHFTRGTLLDKSEVQASFAEQIQQWFSYPIFNTITLVVFWIAVGLTAYTIMFWVYSVITETRNELVVEKEFKHPEGSAPRNHWPLIEFGLFGALVLLALLTLVVFFPVINSWFISFIFDTPGSFVSAAISLVGSLLGMFVIIYAFKIVISTMLSLE